MIKPRLSTWMIAFCALISPAFPAADGDALRQGNPMVPGYFAEPAFWSWAKTPPVGWNSWNAFGSSVKEEQVLANADYMEKHHKAPAR
jgi:hypothetical protein